MLLFNRATIVRKCVLNAVDMVMFLWMVMDILAPVNAIDLARPQIVQQRIVNYLNLINQNDLVDWLKWYHDDIANKSPALEQPPNNFNVTEWAGVNCERYCELNTRPRICYYHWVLEHYHAMGPACGRCAAGVLADCYHPKCITADGVEKGVMSINRQIPGPPIHVCKNDIIVVDVQNNMGGASTSIHFHGLHQRDTPFMDGVPFITQCPIEFSTTFRYMMRATEAGTHFYHSHAGHHKVNGHHGAMIIRQPFESDPNAYLYDHDMTEHVIFGSDWMHEYAEMLMPGLPTRGRILPTNILINGYGRFTDPVTNITTPTPLKIFRVQHGRKYRFRYINSASHVCPQRLQIEGHKLRIIASDGYDVQPRLVDTIMSTSGERYDFVLEAAEIAGDYMVRLRAVGPCNFRRIEQFAILSYATEDEASDIDLCTAHTTFPRYDDDFYLGVQLNHPNATCYQSPGALEICSADLESYGAYQSLDLEIPDISLVLAFDNYNVENSILFSENNYDHFMNTGGSVNLMGAINNMSFMFPSFPPLTQPEDITATTFCNHEESPAHCDAQPGHLCRCTHLLKLELNSVVEMIIIDETENQRELNHPFHIHGHPFHIMGMGQIPKDIPMTKAIARSMFVSKVMDTKPFSHKAPLKDTVSVPSSGYTIVRFRADNPGFWLLHCHFEWHMSVGMGMVVQVGEIADMVKAPNGFPKCGNYMPVVSVNVLNL